MDNPEDLISPDPELTCEQIATATYQGINEGKLDLADTIKMESAGPTPLSYGGRKRRQNKSFYV